MQEYYVPEKKILGRSLCTLRLVSGSFENYVKRNTIDRALGIYSLSIEHYIIKDLTPKWIPT